jgi:TolB protein
MVRFDGENGRAFYYSDGTLELAVPPGEATVAAVQGLATPKATQTVRVASGDTARVTLRLDPVWEGAGHASADHHFHLNYGGPYQLAPSDLALDAKGEALDIATPLLANLHDRFLDQDLWDYEGAPGVPIIEMGQEARSHFLGHLNLLGTEELFWPWVWGPGYEVYGTDDRLNAQALQRASDQGGLGGYVHPVSVRDPFSEEGLSSVPVELVPDAVHGAVDILEVAACGATRSGLRRCGTAC